jgi:hypothetical protein
MDTDSDFVPLLTPRLAGWRMAGAGGVACHDDGVVESYGGSGIFWYAEAAFDDFTLRAAWRLTGSEDNSGIFLRIPPLGNDPRPAIEEGYEVQIDDRGFDPETRRLGSPLHLTGAIYRLAPAAFLASRPIGQWNEFEVTAAQATLAVRLNGALVARLDGASRRSRGHIGLQAHHQGSAVQFRDLRIRPLRPGR